MRDDGGLVKDWGAARDFTSQDSATGIAGGVAVPRGQPGQRDMC